MRRRQLEQFLLTAPVTLLPALNAGSAPNKSVTDEKELEEIRSEWRRLVPDGLEIPEASDKLELSDRQWRERLDADRYGILRDADTEEPYSSSLNAETRPGIYLCAACRLPVFTSDMKFDSGTGWPSFFTSVPGVFDTRKDFVLFIPRTEYHCTRCGSHHGHVFDDGPPPTHERWCNNGLALIFEPLNNAV